MADKLIEIQGINKSFDIQVLYDINLYIRRNEFITLLGPSGCGKTTLLRVLGGFEQPDSGYVRFDGTDITALPAHKRKLNTVFQRYALFPHMNVFDNVAFGMRVDKQSKDFIAAKVRDMLALVDMTGFEKRAVDSLSGGQMQRVAIARALCKQPQVLLLDEPLAALDLKMRKGMQQELKAMQKSLGITFVFVTHDQEEALTMSDTVVVMRAGYIQQIGTPQDIYNEPKNRFVAEFIGESNILPGVVRGPDTVAFGGHTFDCVDRFAANEHVEVVVRPEDIYLVDAERGHIQGEVETFTFMGQYNEMRIRAADGFLWRVQDTGTREVGATVGLIIRPEDIHLMHIDHVLQAAVEEAEIEMAENEGEEN